MITALYNYFRSLAYATPAHRWLGLGRLERYDAAFWDRQLSGEWTTYLGGTISIEARNAIILALIRICAPETKSLLDMACANGSLLRTPGCDYAYTGVDISEVAIAEARKLSPNGTFHASSIQNFVPPHHFDVIVFAEVLHYLSVDAGLSEVNRYSKHCDFIFVSMKRDPKSQAIFRALCSSFTWINGILYQEKIAGPEFATRENREYPAYMIGMFAASPGYQS